MTEIEIETLRLADVMRYAAKHQHESWVALCQEHTRKPSVKQHDAAIARRYQCAVKSLDKAKRALTNYVMTTQSVR